MNLANLSREEKDAMKEHQKQCEARFWVERYKLITKREGKRKAQDWWFKVINDLERIRGVKETQDLRERMNVVKSGNTSIHKK